MQLLFSLLLLAQPHPIGAQTDDPMIRWDCDPAGGRLVLETVRPPVTRVTARELVFLGGAVNFQQCRLGGVTWTLLVDLVEYDSGRCEVEPDTVVSLLRDDRLVVSSAVIGVNCGHRPVFSAARIAEGRGGASPRIELCAASTYGADPRCGPLQLERMQAPLDNDALAARARKSR